MVFSLYCTAEVIFVFLCSVLFLIIVFLCLCFYAFVLCILLLYWDHCY